MLYRGLHNSSSPDLRSKAGLKTVANTKNHLSLKRRIDSKIAYITTLES